MNELITKGSMHSLYLRSIDSLDSHMDRAASQACLPNTAAMSLLSRVAMLAKVGAMDRPDTLRSSSPNRSL